MGKIRVLLSQAFIAMFGAHVKLISDQKYNKILYRLRTGKKADLENPKTFNEHILSRKVHLDEYDLSTFTDKYQVREHVRSVIGEDFLVPCIGVWNSVSDIPFNSLPSQYVLKATHGSGWNLIVKDEVIDFNSRCLSKLKKAMRCNYYYKSREKNYFDIKPRIICEQYITTKDPRGIIDFKVFCFYGKPKFFEVSYLKNNKQYQSLFYTDLNRINTKSNACSVELDEIILSKSNLLIRNAEKLSSRFDFVRVDFFISDDKTYFSELTFHSGGGIKPIEPHEIDVKLGTFFNKPGVSI